MGRPHQPDFCKAVNSLVILYKIADELRGLGCWGVLSVAKGGGIRVSERGATGMVGCRIERGCVMAQAAVKARGLFVDSGRRVITS